VAKVAKKFMRKKITNGKVTEKWSFDFYQCVKMGGELLAFF
jgi:hypothetical protein